MEKIKKILSPGKPVDDEILYGAGRSSSNPPSEHSPAEHGASIVSPGDQVGTSRKADFSEQPAASEPATHDYASQQTPKQLTTETPHHSAVDDAHPANSLSPSAVSTKEQGTSYATTATLRPQPPTPVSAASNASIKSNVVGRVPTGTTLAQEPGDLPIVPATDGKFMNDEALAVGAPSANQGEPSLLPGTSTMAEKGINTSGPHQTALANSLDPSLGPSQTTVEPISDSRIHHYGRDATVASAGLAGVGAYEESKHNKPSEDEPIPSTGLAMTSDKAEPPVTSDTSAPSKPKDDLITRRMPGAYPETPQYESNRNLETAGVGSGAAVLAAQKAYQKHAPIEKPAKPEKAVVEDEATPYSAGLDPRVDATAEQAAERSTAMGTVATPVETAHNTEMQQAKTSGVLAAEKTNQPEEEKDHHVNKVALAGATAATGAGAYEVAKHDEQGPATRSEVEPFPTLADEPAKYQDSADTARLAIPSTDAGKERDFPLGQANDHSQSATNFSYPTGVKETHTKPQEPETAPQYRSIPKEAAENGASGAAGVAAYEALKNDSHGHNARADDLDDPLATAGHAKILEAYEDKRAGPSLAAQHPEYDADATYGHHDAALVGGSTAAATLATAEPFDTKLEKERERVAEKKHDDYEKQEKKARKSEEKARKSEDKARKSEEKHRRSMSKSEDKEHKHGLIHRILHRHKSREGLQDENSEPRSSLEKSQASLDRSQGSLEKSRGSLERPSYEEAGDPSPIASSAGSTPDHSGRHHERNRLHKDPPPGYQSKHVVEDA